jgi:apolipoprotein N-acyltransferase
MDHPDGSLLGAYGLAGLIVLGVAWLVIGRFRLLPVLSTLLLFLMTSAFGLVRSVEIPLNTRLISASVIQGNIDQTVKWSAEYQASSVRKYLDLTRETIDEDRPGLVVWPETALPFYFQEPGELSDLVREFVREHGVPLVVGAPGFTQEGEDFLYHNRSFLLDPRGRTAGHYDKEQLVPFGEYVPFRRFLPFLGKLVEGAGDFSPGRSTAPLITGDIALGPLICYEAIFPKIAQRRVEQGANILVNMSNDAWFGTSSAPRQHLDLAVLRAVEQKRCIIRATNTGISTLIDHRGEIVHPTPLFETMSVHFGTVPLIDQTTFYHRWNDAVGMGIIVLPGLLLGVALVRSRSGVVRDRADSAADPEDA